MLCHENVNYVGQLAAKEVRSRWFVYFVKILTLTNSTGIYTYDASISREQEQIRVNLGDASISREQEQIRVNLGDASITNTCEPGRRKHGCACIFPVNTYFSCAYANACVVALIPVYPVTSLMRNRNPQLTNNAPIPT